MEPERDGRRQTANVMSHTTRSMSTSGDLFLSLAGATIAIFTTGGKNVDHNETASAAAEEWLLPSAVDINIKWQV
jgi:hypothetical protein